MYLPEEGRVVTALVNGIPDGFDLPQCKELVADIMEGKYDERALNIMLPTLLYRYCYGEAVPVIFRNLATHLESGGTLDPSALRVFADVSSASADETDREMPLIIEHEGNPPGWVNGRPPGWPPIE